MNSILKKRVQSKIEHFVHECSNLAVKASTSVKPCNWHRVHYSESKQSNTQSDLIVYDKELTYS